MKSILWPGALLTLALSGSVSAAEDNVHFSGALVSEPCTLPDTDTDIHLDFGSVINKYLYQYKRTKSQPFSIHLEDCDTTIMNTVSIMFQGTGDSELTDMLALETTSTAKGVAVGLEFEDGSLLSLNKASPFRHINTGDNTLTFNAFVQAQPSALINRTLQMGTFTAIGTFILAYK
ncbi:fimbrial protein [Cronobacter dublinensis]|uniref:fimbrial protein n=1 Tax=Cronobacter dublinensis TaxID=413497 RepID=UPI000CFB61FC|nr:fimbrial protein [Cronobacter dublinensis]